MGTKDDEYDYLFKGIHRVAVLATSPCSFWATVVAGFYPGVVFVQLS